MSFTTSSRLQISKLVCIAAGALRVLHIVEYERRSIPLSRVRFVRKRLENPVFPYSPHDAAITFAGGLTARCRIYQNGCNFTARRKIPQKHCEPTHPPTTPMFLIH